MPTVNITLPDGKVLSFDGPVTGLGVAERIGARLAKDALGVKVDGELRDLSAVIDRDAAVSIVTYKGRDGVVSADALKLVRHSAAHIMAEAIGRVVPGALLVYGPALEDKFYYDIKFPEERPLREGDFAKIEEEMGRIVSEDRKFTRYEINPEEGLVRLKQEGNKYKVDNAERAMMAAGGSSLGTRHSALSFYATGTPGKDWEDLCRGPHVPSTGRIGAIKVLSLASSFWHGDENSDRLTRVYGTAFATQAEMDAYFALKEEAAKRDHRVLGKQLHLFHIDESVGQGLILWTPNGGVVRDQLQKFISEELVKQGYHQVFTPHIGRLELYKTSGHFPYYKESQFAPVIEREALEELSKSGCSCSEMMHRVEGVSARLAATINERTQKQTITPDRVLADDKLVEGFMLKPMNCPHHIKIFASRAYSYRDLPVRLAEFGTVYRWEQSGELNGMTRVRGFTQDDAHLFCTEDQVAAELIGCLSLVKTVLGTLKMENYRVRVGLRDPDGKKYTGSASAWDKAENACRDAARTLGVAFSEEPGEAAFYGPKIDFVVKDVIGREWQLGTVQVDYQLPVRFGLSYTGADNKPHVPVMIHRAPFGSLERFTGVLIEHFAGAFPAWLSPEQVRVLPISEKSNAYAHRVAGELRARGVRVGVDDGNERVQGKIKVAAEMKVPYMAVVGPRDAEHGTVSVRVRGQEKDAGAMALGAFVEGVAGEIAGRVAGLGVRP
ncbi:MAG: threonine--tRNA ligase [Phycisphaeraceae bacterium]|nr:threonine--tRNA ligase [Phycisphaeraceae bacterium]